jgi:hypothetical protein
MLTPKKKNNVHAEAYYSILTTLRMLRTEQEPKISYHIMCSVKLFHKSCDYKTMLHMQCWLRCRIIHGPNIVLMKSITRII